MRTGWNCHVRMASSAGVAKTGSPSSPVRSSVFPLFPTRARSSTLPSIPAFRDSFGSGSGMLSGSLQGWILGAVVASAAEESANEPPNRTATTTNPMRLVVRVPGMPLKDAPKGLQ